MEPKTEKTGGVMVRAVSLLGVFALLWSAIGPAAATEALFSRVDVNGYIDRIGCISAGFGNYDCVGGIDTDHYGDGIEVVKTNSEIASIAGKAPVPTVGGLLSESSARAQTDLWSNRAEAHAVSTTVRFTDEFGHIQLEEGRAQANARSAWTTPLTFLRGSGVGTATMRFRITGSLSMTGVTDGVTSATVGFGFLSLPGLVPDLATGGGPGFGLTMEDTTVDEVFDVSFPFVFGVPQQAMGVLAMSVSSHSYHEIDFDVPPEGYDIIGIAHTGVVHAEFFSTVQVEQLIVPAGATAVGANGNALPFAVVAVPEPQTYALFALGLGIVAAATRRRRHIDTLA
jgi:hypothetical protein